MRNFLQLNVFTARRPIARLFSPTGRSIFLLMLVLGLSLISFASNQAAYARQTHRNEERSISAGGMEQSIENG